MGDKTKIEWTEATWNPLRGCSRVSEGCRNCYAEQVAGRFSGPGMPYEGLITKTAKGPTWNGSIKLVPEKLTEPLNWKKPRRIFVNSMSDLFHESVPDEYIHRVFAVMALAPQHTFQVLTKRADRMLKYVTGDYHSKTEPWPLSNVWLGVSVENQATAEERIPLLLQTPSDVRWVSAEPLLGPVSFRWAKWCDYKSPGTHNHLDGMKGIDWVVVGGESGKNARPMHPDWAGSLRDQCQAAGVPFFFKQWGEWRPISQGGDSWYDSLYKPKVIAVDHENQDALNEIYGRTCTVKDGILHIDGSLHDISLGAFEHGTGAMHTFNVGKKAAGRLLDDCEWNEYPS